MAADAGEGPGAWPLQDLDRGIVPFQPGINRFHVFDLKTKMIESGLASRLALSWIDVQSDITVSHHHSAKGSRILGGFHAEHPLIKSPQERILITHDGHVFEFCKHIRISPFA